MRKMSLSLEGSQEELLRPTFLITELKIPELPQKRGSALLKDKNSKRLTTMKKSKMVQTIFTIKARTKITKKMDIFIRKE